ncbi:MAG: preprotein translocase subunit SecG [Paracoccaceae bacterium]
MENVILTVHLILALLLIGVVLLQRNEGGALLSGGGAMTARGAANALTRLTWIFAACFICTSIALTYLSARNAKGTSVLDTSAPAAATAPAAPAAPPAPEGNLLPPSDATQGNATTSAPAASTGSATAPASSAPASTAPSN